MIQGIGTGIALPLMFNTILEQVPKSRVGTMMGVGNMITGIAPALGPTFAGVVLESLGWRWVFWFLIPLILISLFLGLWEIEQKSKIQRVPIDKFSFLMIAIFFIGMIYGFSNLGSGDLIKILIPIITALIGLGLLIHRSNHLSKPILNLSLFKNARFTGHVLGFFLPAMMSSAFLIPLKM